MPNFSSMVWTCHGDQLSPTFLGDIPQKHLLHQTLELPCPAQQVSPCARAQPQPKPPTQHSRPLSLHNLHSDLVSLMQHPHSWCEHRTTSAQNPAYPHHNSPRAITQANQPKFAGALKALSASTASSSPHFILPPSAVSAAELASSLSLLYYHLYFYCSPCTW